MPSITVDFSDLDHIVADVILASGSRLAIVGDGLKVADSLQGLPTGGTTGQVLTKSSNSNFAVGWTTPSGGGGGSVSVLAPTTVAKTYVSDGDNNDVFHFIGTHYGETAWANPYTAGRLGIIVHPNTIGDPDLPRYLVDQAPNHFTTDPAFPFIIFDLGQNSNLILDRYSYRFREDVITFTPTAINVSGSHDNVTYDLIDSQTGLSAALNAWVSPAVVGQVTSYRYIKFEQITGTDGGFFSASEIALYGSFTYGAPFFDGSLAAFVNDSTIQPLGDDASTPTTPGTIVGWIKFNKGGADAWLPYYQ